jgi:hypothetical protein
MEISVGTNLEQMQRRIRFGGYDEVGFARRSMCDCAMSMEQRGRSTEVQDFPFSFFPFSISSHSALEHRELARLFSPSFPCPTIPDKEEARLDRSADVFNSKRSLLRFHRFVLTLQLLSSSSVLHLPSRSSLNGY